MKVAFDIDGVLADNPYYARYVSDWDAFIKAIPKDRPIETGVALIRALYLSRLPVHEVCFITGRPEVARSATAEWLSRNCDLPMLPPNGPRLYMREPGPDQNPASFKLAACELVKPDLMVEDDEESARLLTLNGFKVLLFLRGGGAVSVKHQCGALKEMGMTTVFDGECWWLESVETGERGVSPVRFCMCCGVDLKEEE